IWLCIPFHRYGNLNLKGRSSADTDFRGCCESTPILWSVNIRTIRVNTCPLARQPIRNRTYEKVYIVPVAIITVTYRLTYIPWGTRNDTEITDIHGSIRVSVISVSFRVPYRIARQSIRYRIYEPEYLGSGGSLARISR